MQCLSGSADRRVVILYRRREQGNHAQRCPWAFLMQLLLLDEECVCVYVREGEGEGEGERKGQGRRQPNLDPETGRQTERPQSRIFPLSSPLSPSTGNPPLRRHTSVQSHHTRIRKKGLSWKPARQAGVARPVSGVSEAWPFTIPRSDISHERLNELALGSIPGRCSLSL